MLETLAVRALHPRTKTRRQRLLGEGPGVRVHGRLPRETGENLMNRVVAGQCLDGFGGRFAWGAALTDRRRDARFQRLRLLVELVQSVLVKMAHGDGLLVAHSGELDAKLHEQV
ncbi:hypothetical protein [Haliangium ochraceum]|uniref:hypothetical protein n=1 Tax=Haliangium ochraceum TaxID=80816 RepID=UPI001E2F0C4F|nr:hypothetical protein [Haliangium ochraceum]